MTLRARLTALYSSIVGGILLLFGLAIYGAVSVNLTAQIDKILRSTASDVIQKVYVDSSGALNIVQSPIIDLSTDVYFQIWGRDKTLRAISPNISNFNLPLDSAGLQEITPVYKDLNISTNTGTGHLRTLSVPLMLGNRLVGTLQVGTSLAVVDATQKSLLIILVVGVVVSMSVAGLAGWISTYHALSPLENVTQTALQITHADDLSRRIPYEGPANDEVGKLIKAFNKTLERLENLFNSQRRFLADISHELRTPLTVIIGNIDLIRRMGASDKESINSIESEAQRLNRMVGDLLLLAQAESGKIPLDKQIVELDTLLLEVLQQMQVLAGEKVRLNLADIDQVLIYGDFDKLKQVMVNLIGNAVKYTPEGGEVTISLAKEENFARMMVRDNGPGIPEKDIPHIFERFYRGEKSRQRTSDGKGFGLGLSIVYWIVRNHKGIIDVESQMGEGTVFIVKLPLAQGNRSDNN